MSGALFADESGEGGPPLVLLHGFGGTHHVWDGVRAALGGGRHVIAYDLPGQGRSLDFDGSVTASGAARAIAADLEGRGVTHLHVAGHSMGGAVAALMALAAPERIASLTLLAPGGFGPDINGRLLRRFAPAREANDIRAALEGMFGFKSPVPEEAVEQLARLRAGPGQTEKLQEIVGRIARDSTQGEIARNQLATLPMPVQVAWGGLDAVLPPRHAEELPGHFTLHRFPDLGHMLPEEAPAEMAEVLRAVLG